MTRVPIAALLIATAVATAVADEGWLVERFAVTYDLQSDGTVVTAEEIDVDFRGLSKHGIYRDIRNLMGFDAERNRRYDVDLERVQRADGSRHEVATSQDGDVVRFRIGDPDRTLSGRETYRLAYTLRGALNALPDHDEFYWNVTGDAWPVRMARVSAVVRAPAGAIQRADCFQGVRGSLEKCAMRLTASEATFAATRPLAEREQVTIVVALRKGAVTVPAPLLERRPRTLVEFFDWTPAIATTTVAGLVAAIGGVGLLWWRVGRDRRYVSVQHLSRDTSEETLPLFGAHPVAVEFEPPENIRPAQMGVLLDERADTLDVTATIVDLAVRGYLKITELPKAWVFSKKDWQLDRLKPADGALLEYERIVLAGLFDGADSRKLSDLKTKFHDDLSAARKALYADAIERRWFSRNPANVRTLFTVLGVALGIAGVCAVPWLGSQWGAGLAALPLVALGLMLILFARAMPRRTAAGREMLRRTLGFVRYIRTGEAAQQAFAERANLFTRYLPYAVAFKCVDRWARAFDDIDAQAATAGFYSGTAGFDGGRFSSALGSFSSSVSGTIASTPGSSGGSGFSGGSSGGGGGGGGGGSW